MIGYKELVNEIELHKNLYESHEISFNYWNDKIAAWKPGELKAQQYSDMPHGSKDLPDTMTVMCKTIAFKNAMDAEKSVLDKLIDKKKIIDYYIDSIDDVTVKIKKLRGIGLTQAQVADIVHVSDRHVRRLEKK